MINWTWESPQTWVALTAAVLGPMAWVAVTWLKGRCRHHWESVGSVYEERDWNGNAWVQFKYQPLRCADCGKVRRFRT